MGITDNLALRLQEQKEQENVAPAPQQPAWIKDLIDNRYRPQTERIKRKPIGFEFQRDPFDPSSYYKQLGTLRDISNTQTVAAQNRANYASYQNAMNQQNSGSPNIGAAIGNVAGNWATGSSKKYGLKGISSNTSKAADYWGGRYNIKTVGGYRSHGSVPGSDHPKGRALDFMINNIKNGKKVGTALANDIIKNYKQWNVKYVIWNRHIWSPGRGWRKYNGPSPHTDHVHVSFKK